MRDNHGALELDLKSFGWLLKNNINYFVLALILATLFSGYQIFDAPHRYKAEVMVTVGDTSRANSPIFLGQSNGLMNLLPLGNSKEIEILPTVTGRRFLNSFVEKERLQNKIPVSDIVSLPSPFSLAGLLHLLNIYRPVQVEVSQQDQLVNKIKGMIEIEHYSFNGIVTSAYLVKIKNRDPVLAAFLANSLVEHFFSYNKLEKEKAFTEELKVLSKNVVEAEIFVNEARIKRDNFLINHPSVFEGSNGGNISSTNYRALQVVELEKLREQKKLLLRLIEKLEQSIKIEKLSEIYFNSQEDLSNLSNKFLNELEEIQKRNERQSERLNDARNLIGAELVRIREILASVTKAEKKKEGDLANFFKLETKLRKLNIELETARQFAGSLKEVLKQKELERERFGVGGEIKSPAIVPSYPYSPNIRNTFIINTAIFIVVTLFYVFLRQLLNLFVYSPRQLSHLSELKNIITIKEKNLRNMSPQRSKKIKTNVISPNFLNDIQNVGKVGCIIEISSPKFYKKSLSDKTNLFFSEIFLKEGKTVFSLLEEFEMDYKMNSNTKNTQIHLIEKDYEKTLEKRTFIPLKEKLLNFGLVLVSLRKGIDGFIINELMSQTDFFIIVGRAGEFKVSDLEYFFSENVENRDKCKGLLIVG